MRRYEELPCGCLISEDGGGGLIPCSYPEIGQKITKLHKKCMDLYFRQHKSVFDIWEIIIKEGWKTMKHNLPKIWLKHIRQEMLEWYVVNFLDRDWKTMTKKCECVIKEVWFSYPECKQLCTKIGGNTQ